MKSRNASSLLLSSLLLPLLAAPTPAQAPSRSVDELVRGSHIIFVGRVLKTGAVNLRVLSPSERTALVRVEELLDSPASMAGIQGQEVTMELAQGGEAKAGDSAVFFTNGILFGEHLEVKEVGRMPVPENRGALRQEISAVRTRMEEEKVQARVNSAVLIVVGRVMETEPVERTGPISEHQPDWARAIVQVEGVEKGSWQAKTVTVYFPQSTDERWLLSPKFHIKQEGIWLLHLEKNLGLPADAFLALSPLDFHERDKAEMIRRLAH